MANCIVMGWLPMLILSILNWLIFHAISRTHTLPASQMFGNAHRCDSTMATVLTAIVIVFVVQSTPKAALTIYEICSVSIVVDGNIKMDEIISTHSGTLYLKTSRESGALSLLGYSHQHQPPTHCHQLISQHHCLGTQGSNQFIVSATRLSPCPRGLGSWTRTC